MSRPPKITNTKKPTQTQVATLTQQALTFHQQGNFDEAQAIYEKILLIQPDLITAHYNLSLFNTLARASRLCTLINSQ